MAALTSIATFGTRDGQQLNPQIPVIGWYWIAEARGECKRLMQKEIYMQAYSPADSIGGRSHLACVIASAGPRPEGVIRHFPTPNVFDVLHFALLRSLTKCVTLHIQIIPSPNKAMCAG